MDSATFDQRVGDAIVADFEIAPAVKCNAVRQAGRRHAVPANDDVLVDEPVGPGRNAIVAGVPNAVVLDPRVADAAVQIDPVRSLIGDFDIGDQEVAGGTI